MTKRRLRFNMRPIQVLPIGFLVVILIGTGLLLLPASTMHGQPPITFLEALFTATSATCVTGLVVVDTGTAYSTFGHVVILTLIQVGGLGFMSMATLLFRAVGKKISLRERMVMAEAMNADRLQGIVGLAINAMKLTFSVELVGAALLSIRFIPEFGVAKGIWYSLFHSISAFCNAGFDLLGNYASLTMYQGDWLINLTVMGLIIAGGLGFVVLIDMGKTRPIQKWKLHTKLVVCANVILLLGGAILFLFLEWNNDATIGTLNASDKVLASFFQSVTLRTAGFNTIDQLALTDASKIFSMILMCIGASPAGTGGGVKVTTAALLILEVVSITRNRNEVRIFNRRIAQNTVRRAVTILLLFVMMLLLTVAVICAIEANTAAGALGLENIMFELSSAFGTVGVSVGATALLSTPSRILVILAMFIGRLGPLTMMLSFAGRPNDEGKIRYVEGQLLVG